MAGTGCNIGLESHYIVKWTNNTITKDFCPTLLHTMLTPIIIIVIILAYDMAGILPLVNAAVRSVASVCARLSGCPVLHKHQ